MYIYSIYIERERWGLRQAIDAGQLAAQRCADLEEVEQECSVLRAEVSRLEEAVETASFEAVTCARRVYDVLLTQEIDLMRIMLFYK